MADFVFPMPGSSPTPVKPPKPGPRLKPIPVVRGGKPVTAAEVNKEKKKKTDADKEITASDIYSSVVNTPAAGGALMKAAPAGLATFAKEVALPTERISREEAESAGRFSPKSLLRGIQGLPVVGLAFSDFGKEMMDSIISTGKSALEVTSFGQASFSKDDPNSYRNTLARGESLLPKMVEDAGNISLALHGVGAGLKGVSTRGNFAGTAQGAAAVSAAGKFTTAGRLADKFGALPITVPFKTVGRVGRTGTQYGRTHANKLRAKADAISSVDPNSSAAKTYYNRANTWERFSGREVIDAAGNKIVIEPGFVSRFAKRAVFNASKNNTEIVNTMLSILDDPLLKDEPNPNVPGEKWGSLSADEQQAVIATYIGRAQEMQKIAEITGLPIDRIVQYGRYNYRGDYSLTPTGGQLAVDFVNHTEANPTMSEQQYARLADAADRFRTGMGKYSDQARAGYGRAEPLPEAYDVPTPDPGLLLAELQKVGHPLAEQLQNALAEIPEPGAFRLSENPKDPTRIQFLKWIVEHSPDKVALNETIYPPAMRGNIAFYKRVREALFAEGARKIGGATPPDGGVGSAPPKPGSFDPNSGLPTPESFADAKEPGTLAKFPRQYIQNTMTQLDRLRGTQRKIATRLASVVLQIADKERIGLKLQIKMQINEANIEIQRAKVAKLTETYKQMKADQADSVVREGKIYTEEQLAAELADENEALQSLEDDTVGLETAADELVDQIDALENEAVAAGEQLDREGGDSLAIEKAVESDRAKFPESQVTIDLQEQLGVLQKEYDVITADLKVLEKNLEDVQEELAAEINKSQPIAAPSTPPVAQSSQETVLSLLEESIKTGKSSTAEVNRAKKTFDTEYVPPKDDVAVSKNLDKVVSAAENMGLRDKARGGLFVMNYKGAVWITNSYILTKLDPESFLFKKLSKDRFVFLHFFCPIYPLLCIKFF